MITPHIILTLLLLLSVAWILGNLFTRLGLPAMLGELCAGLILGPPLLGVVGPSPPVDTLAELGIFFVMFHTGMELDPKELLEHVWPSLGVAFGGFVLPFTIGYFCAREFGGTTFQSLFVGLGLSITAIAVQSVVLHSINISRSALGHVIIGAAIADDIFALVSFSTLIGLARTGSFQVTALFTILVKVGAFFAATILVGHFVMPRFTRRLTDEGGKAFTFALTAALLMAYLAEWAGLHPIIGAFLAGQFVREEVMDRDVYRAISDRFFGISYGFLVPIFFVSLSFHLHFPWTWHFAVFALLLTVVAVLGKVIGCGVGAATFGHNLWESAIIGLGMNGRGAVELVVAKIVMELSEQLEAGGTAAGPLLTTEQFSGLVLMAFATTLVAPISLKWAVLRTCHPNKRADFCQLWDGGSGGLLK